MSFTQFIVDMKLNLFCHFMVCADVHKYIQNRYYRQENYGLFDEDAYRFFREEIPVYCLELLLKIVSDHPRFDVDCIEQSLGSKFRTKRLQAFSISPRFVSLFPIPLHIKAHNTLSARWGAVSLCKTFLNDGSQ